MFSTSNGELLSKILNNYIKLGKNIASEFSSWDEEEIKLDNEIPVHQGKALQLIRSLGKIDSTIYTARFYQKYSNLTLFTKSETEKLIFCLACDFNKLTYELYKLSKYFEPGYRRDICINYLRSVQSNIESFQRNFQKSRRYFDKKFRLKN